MTWARWIFILAGVYGLLIIPPMYFLEAKIGRDQPAGITHPEFFYGFLGVVLAWQIAFLVIARDPLRYRTIMLAAVVEKMSYAAAIAILFWQQRVTWPLLISALLDFIFGVLFCLAYLETSRLDRTIGARNLPEEPTESAGPLI